MDDLEKGGSIPMVGGRRPAPALAGQTQGPGVETQAWAVVLARGRGVRLRGLTRHVYGEDRPKQYAALTGGKSFLRQTIERVSLRIPSGRTVVVTMAAQGSYLTMELRHELLWHRAPGRPVSESGRLCRGDGGHGRGGRRRMLLMSPSLPVGTAFSINISFPPIGERWGVLHSR